ncbi:unnamed protein product [Closterium sp. Naga37s-1]|nr:unnamed protein product [Closterium sp. Naga37s-1]
MTDQQLMDECITFLLAGHGTTARLLTWTFYLLAKHPDWQERLRVELKQALTQQGARDTSAVATATTAAGAADKAGSGAAAAGKPGETNQGASGREGEEGGQEGGEREGGERGESEREGGGGRVTWEVVALLKDMGMVLQESLRMFPPVSFMGRTCQQVRLETGCRLSAVGSARWVQMQGGLVWAGGGGGHIGVAGEPAHVPPRPLHGPHVPAGR